jgi:CheY-like chemotaxis protein
MSRNILAAVDDMFFASKIRAVAEHLGLTVQFAKSVAAVTEAARKEAPAVIVVDLHSQRCQPLELARELKADHDLRSIPLIGFFSHVETALQAAAQEAGYDHVMPRSLFTRNLAQILRGQYPIQ